MKKRIAHKIMRQITNGREYSEKQNRQAVRKHNKRIRNHLKKINKKGGALYWVGN